jgi:hypothetical protein
MTRDRESLRRSVVSLSTLLITLFVVTLPAQVSGADDVVPIAVSSDFEVRSYLVENLGQLNRADVAYFTRSREFEVGFARGRVLYHALKWEPSAEEGWRHAGGLLFTLELGDGTAQPNGRENLAGRSHYLVGTDRDDWIQGARHFGRIFYRDVYPGIDMVFFFDKGDHLTYEFLVAPGADPTQIALRYTSVEGVEAGGPAVMQVNTGLGVLTDGELVTYQVVDGQRQRVASGFRKLGNASYGVEILEPYDTLRPLVIDPTLEFSSYWGDGGAVNRTVVLDKEGNIYMSGGTSSVTWPSTAGAYDTSHYGPGPTGFTWPDVTAAKFDPSGNVIWSTFIGGPNEEYAYVSAVNSSGELYLSGRAGDGFPTTPGAFDETFNGGIPNGQIHSPSDAFVAKLSANGDQLLYSTYIGGSGNENGRAIHLLPSGELLVGGGNTQSKDLPTTPGAYKPNLTGAKDNWVARVSTDGSSLGFLTYFGPGNDPGGYETLFALGTDSSGNIWIGGTTSGDDLVATADAFQPNHGGGRSEAYIAKLSADGESLMYFSWLGGSGFEEIETEGVSDTAGNFYVAGSTSSTDFPVTPGAFQTTLKGGGGTFDGDGWVAKIDTDGKLVFATLFGGSRQGSEGFFGPVVDGAGNVYVTGRFRSDDCPVTTDAFQPEKADAGNNTQDAFLAVFSPDGRNLLYGSYFGGTGTDHGRHLGIHPDGSTIVIIGETGSKDLPLVNAPQSSPAGAYLAKFRVSDLSAALFVHGFESETNK